MSASADLLKELRIDRKAAPPAPPRRGPWIVLGVLAVVALAGAGAWWMLRHKPVDVRTAPVAAIAAGGESASVLDASGYVVARRMATVSAKITGKVREVFIEEGMRVEQGQVMATLDPVDADAQRALSAAQLEQSRTQVANIQAQLKQAEADARRLHAGRPAAGFALAVRPGRRRARCPARAAAGDRTQRRRGRALVDHRRQRRGQHHRARAVCRRGHGQGRAAGEIVSPLATGGFTRTGIGTIVDMDSLEVEVDVGEAYIGRVQPKMPAEVVLNAYPDWRIPAEVIAIIPAADRGKATVKVRVG
jgi:multidrug efflux pump subunit AcrA (membrane-fusion protein)